MILLIVKKTLCTFQSAKIITNRYNLRLSAKTEVFTEALIYEKILG